MLDKPLDTFMTALARDLQSNEADTDETKLLFCLLLITLSGLAVAAVAVVKATLGLSL